MQIYDHVNIDKEQAARYLALRKKDASITWDDIINKGLVACEVMVTGSWRSNVEDIHGRGGER